MSIHTPLHPLSDSPDWNTLDLGFGECAAAEQLFDELLARVDAVTRLIDLPATGDRTVTTSTVTAARATALIGGLGDSPDRPAELVRSLWPHGTAPAHDHPWWSTPLGVLLVELGG